MCAFGCDIGVGKGEGSSIGKTGVTMRLRLTMGRPSCVCRLRGGGRVYTIPGGGSIRFGGLRNRAEEGVGEFKVSEAQ